MLGGWPDVVTPKDIASTLGISPKRLRARLRVWYPDHPRYQRWKFSSDEADRIVWRYRGARFD